MPRDNRVCFVPSLIPAMPLLCTESGILAGVTGGLALVVSLAAAEGFMSSPPQSRSSNLWRLTDAATTPLPLCVPAEDQDEMLLTGSAADRWCSDTNLFGAAGPRCPSCHCRWSQCLVPRVCCLLAEKLFLAVLESVVVSQLLQPAPVPRRSGSAAAA